MCESRNMKQQNDPTRTKARRWGGGGGGAVNLPPFRLNDAQVNMFTISSEKKKFFYLFIYILFNHLFLALNSVNALDVQCRHIDVGDWNAVFFF